MSMHGRKNPNAGRKEINLDVTQVRELASKGLTEQQIADVLGVNWKTLAARKKKYAEFLEALSIGKALGIQTATNALFESVQSGHFPAIKFYLCNRDPENWKDKREVDSKSEEAVTVIHYECERDL